MPRGKPNKNKSHVVGLPPPPPDVGHYEQTPSMIYSEHHPGHLTYHPDEHPYMPRHHHSHSSSSDSSSSSSGSSSSESFSSHSSSSSDSSESESSNYSTSSSEEEERRSKKSKRRHNKMMNQPPSPSYYPPPPPHPVQSMEVPYRPVNEDEETETSSPVAQSDGTSHKKCSKKQKKRMMKRMKKNERKRMMLMTEEENGGRQKQAPGMAHFHHQQQQQQRHSNPAAQNNVPSSCEKHGTSGNKKRGDRDFSSSSTHQGKSQRISEGQMPSSGGKGSSPSAVPASGWESTEFTIKIVGTPRELDQLASRDENGRIRLTLDNNFVTVTQTNSTSMQDRLRMHANGGNTAGTQVESSGNRNGNDSGEDNSTGDDVPNHGSTVEKSPLKQENDIVQNVRILKQQSDFPHPVQWDIDNIVIPGRYDPNRMTPGLSHVTHSNESSSVPFDIGQGKITENVVEYHQRYPSYGNIGDMTRDDVYHKDTKGKVKVFHSNEMPHPVIDSILAEQNKKLRESKKQQDEFAAKEAARIESERVLQRQQYGNNNTSRRQQQQQVPSAAPRRSVHSVVEAYSIPDKEKIMISNDDLNMVRLRQKDFEKALKRLKDDPNFRKNGSVLSNVAKPVVYVTPSTRRGDVASLLKGGSLDNSNTTTASTNTTSSSSLAAPPGGYSSTRHHRGISHKAREGAKTQQQEQQASSATKKNTREDAVDEDGSQKRSNPWSEAVGSNHDQDRKHQAILTFVVESIPTSKLRQGSVVS